ncbi:MAG: PAS domain-containing sensor histidine kinase [Campylobacterota bacterium]|nr:PAS domain-containing sensor histidine kinase [Campylobacterota bacterium]
MLKKLLSLNYEDKLVLEMLKISAFGAVAVNTIVVAAIALVLYEQIPTLYLFIWISLNISLLSMRTYVGKKLSFYIKIQNNLKHIYFKYYLFLVSLMALSLSMISVLSVIYNVPDVEIIFIAGIIIALTAGSLATMGTILILFLLYTFLNIVPLILSFIYHGGMIFDIFAIFLLIYLIINTLSGYRLFSIHQNSSMLEKKFRTIFNKTSDGVVLIKNNRFIECNETIIKMFGYNSEMEEFLKVELSTLMPLKQPDGVLSSRKMMRMLREAKDARNTFEWLFIKKNGDEFYSEVTLSEIELDDEKIILGVWRDITDRIKAQQKIEQLNQTLEARVKLEVEKNIKKDQKLVQQSRLAQMGEMINMIAHQWRQPLTAISATSAAINMKIKIGQIDNDKIIELTDKISSYSQHLSLTIDDFRDFFKPNKEKQDVTFDELIQSVLNIIDNTIRNKNIEIVQDLQSKTLFHTYSNEMKHVILNLVKNAEDALVENETKNAKITIKTKDNILTISDNGGGIKAEILDKIFDPYFSTKKEKDGTGLGLYMSKTIIQEHCGGKISVSNANDGAVFEIVLPNL